MKQKILFLALIIGLLVSLTLVSAQTNMLTQVGNYAHNLTNGVPDTAKTGLGKILLATLVVLLVYSIASFVPFISERGETIQWLFAIIIGALGFLFVSPENIQFIMSNYEALAIALTTILPLLIIIGFSLRIATDENYTLSWATFISRFAIVLFIIYDIGRWLTISWNPSGPTPELAWVYPLSLIIALIWYFAVKPTARLVLNQKKRGKQEGIENMNANAALNVYNQAETLQINQMLVKIQQGKKLTKVEQLLYVRVFGRKPPKMKIIRAYGPE